MIRYVTRNSTYEVDGSRIRRVSGENPSVLPAPDGEWVEADVVGTVVLGAGKVLVAEKDGRGLIMTSAIEDEQEPGQCLFETRPATLLDQSEVCGDETEPGSELCPIHEEATL